MKYFIDTEFIERGHLYPIELISIALVREDGVTFYREMMDGWHPENANDWVRANVLERFIHVTLAPWLMPGEREWFQPTSTVLGFIQWLSLGVP